jgi:hypothetical protein
MKVKVTRSTRSWFTDNREIEIEVPNGTEDIETFIKEHFETNEDDVEEKFFEAEAEEEYADPDSVYYTVKDDKGEITQWED